VIELLSDSDDDDAPSASGTCSSLFILAVVPYFFPQPVVDQGNRVRRR
jgi:hypothetical protein